MFAKMQIALPAILQGYFNLGRSGIGLTKETDRVKTTVIDAPVGISCDGENEVAVEGPVANDAFIS